jgi:hypothetical protein
MNPFVNSAWAYVYGDSLKEAWAARAAAFSQYQSAIGLAVSDGLNYNGAGLTIPAGMWSSGN